MITTAVVALGSHISQTNLWVAFDWAKTSSQVVMEGWANQPEVDPAANY
jgi:hypothetical protein